MKLKEFMALALIPPNMIENALENLKEDCQEDKFDDFEPFIFYMEGYWIKSSLFFGVRCNISYK